ncbi:MAG: PEGA domain-containing protein, partial [Myxococcota bacterium]|nr:PEGA domain-containing protein [Myxococcota bacterium]
YVLVRRLAKGGMAEIFLARKEGPEGFARDLVVKRILPHLSEDPELMAMFREEARIVARLGHPNVVHVYDFGEVGGTAYLVMELVRGVDLRALIVRAREQAIAARRPGAVPMHHAAKILSHVCEGLAHAHDLSDARGRPLGLVHRDVTPSNVLLGFEGAVKVADFGVAKLQRGRKEITRVGMVRGKSAYLSPEQARGESLDRRSDLFNVGILLFEVLTGDTLFPHEDPVHARTLAAAGKIPEPERLQMLPPGLREIATRALAARREERYPDALALRADLERFLRAVPETSDTLELGRYVRRLFPDVVEEDRRGPRAAGTVPLTGVVTPNGPPGTAPIAPPSVGTALLDGTPPSGEASFSDTPVDPTFAAGFRDLRESSALSPVSRSGLTSSSNAPSPSRSSSASPPAWSTNVPVAVTQKVPSVAPPPRSHRARRWAPFLLVPIAGLLSWLVFRTPDDIAPPPLELPSDPDRPVVERLPTPPAHLRITTEPAGLTLRVDTVEHGPAPLRLAVEPGPHVVEALEEGRVVASRTLEVTAATEVDVLLQARTTEARLRVVSEPSGAVVLVGDERVGRTPLDVGVAPGEHVVTLRLDGYQEHQAPVLALEGGVATFSAVLRREPRPRNPVVTPRGTGTLAMATTPWCDVFLGRRKLGTTPFTNVSLPAGTHTLTLRAPGKPERRHVVTIRAGEESRVRLAL